MRGEHCMSSPVSGAQWASRRIQSRHLRSGWASHHLAWVRFVLLPATPVLRARARFVHRSGGKAESLRNQNGVATLHEASDQHHGDKSVRALLSTYLMKRPVALIIDDRYALFPYDLTSKKDCTYAVLGFYHIAHAWGEYSSDVMPVAADDINGA